jgi:Aldo/keto reductase family
MDEARRHCEKVRDLALLAEKLGCSTTQLSIAWSLKHEPVQCLLLGATSTEQLHMNLQALQLLPRLSVAVMLEVERILDNKPVRPAPISTLALRWQSGGPGSQYSQGPPSVISGMGLSGIAGSPKDENLSLAGDDQKESSKMSFCEIQWQKINPGTLDSNKSKGSGKKSEKSALTNTKEFIRDYKSIPTSTSTTFNKAETSMESPTAEEKAKMKIKRNSSLISLKSINQNLKAMLKITRNDTSSSSDAEIGEATKLMSKKPPNPPMAPSLRIDDVDIDDTKMLLNYPQSPQRYPSSSASVTPAVTPTTSSTTALLQYQEYVPRSASPGPYLSISVSPRRSSTSDILNKKTPSGSATETPSKKSSQFLHSNSGSGTTLAADPNLLNAAITKDQRRPSTSELLRKARERKGSEGKLGRSISTGGSLAKGNRNRRLSMAF